MSRRAEMRLRPKRFGPGKRRSIRGQPRCVNGKPPRLWLKRIRGYKPFQAGHVHDPGIERVVVLQTLPPTLAVGRQAHVRGCFEQRRRHTGVERLPRRAHCAGSTCRVEVITDGAEPVPCWCGHSQQDGLMRRFLSCYWLTCYWLKCEPSTTPIVCRPVLLVTRLRRSG